MSTENRTKVIVPCRLSYAHLWEPDSVNGSELKYSVSCIIDKKDKDTVATVSYTHLADERIGAFLPCRLTLFNSVGSVILYRFHQFIRIIIRDRPLGPFLQMFFDKVFRHLMSGSPLCRIRGLLIRKLLFQLKGGRAA